MKDYYCCIKYFHNLGSHFQTELHHYSIYFEVGCTQHSPSKSLCDCYSIRDITLHGRVPFKYMSRSLHFQEATNMF